MEVKAKLTVIIVVPVGLLDGVAVGDGVGGRGRGQVGRHAAHRHRLPVSVRRVRVEGAELRVLGDGRALERVPVQVVPRVAGNAGRVGDGPHGHLGRDVRVDVPVELGVEVRPLQEGVRRARAARALVVVAAAGLRLPAAGLLADDDEEEHQDEDAGHEDDDADHLLQADVPGGGDELVADLGAQFARGPAEAQRAVAPVGAVRVLAPAPVGTRALRALVHVAQAPGWTRRDRRGASRKVTTLVLGDV